MENIYQQFVIQMLSETFKEEWMNDNDWDLFLYEIKKEVDFNEIENELKIGESNGFSLEEQKQIIKKLFKK